LLSSFLSHEMKLARTHLEMLIWPLLAFLCVILMGSWRSAPLSDDSYQYLNVADRYLILYKDSSSTDDIELLASSSFLAGAASQHLACGFVVAAEIPPCAFWS